MTQLPNDVLNEIFLHLHQIDKVECMLVCHLWKRIIESYSLYHTIVLRELSNLNAIAAKVEENPEISKRIQQIVIFDDESDNTETDFTILFLSLSNLQELFSFRSYSGVFRMCINFDEKMEYPWHNSIEYIDYRLDTKFSQLFSSCTYPNLTTLFTDMDEKKNIIKLLKNTPALKNLTIRKGKITFGELNTLHENTPLLESLTLSNILIDDTGFEDTVFHPTTVVTKCYYVHPNTNELQKIAHWLTYISKKYPNLSEFGLSTGSDSRSLTDDHLEHFHMNGWVPLLQNIGPKLKKLRFSSVMVNGSGFFELLDKSGCEISHLYIPRIQSDTIENLVRSQQIKYIETLALNLIQDQTMEWLNELHVLKNLGLTAIGLPIELDDILEHSPPTLRSLSLKYATITASPDYAKKSRLETLHFEEVYLPEKMDVFINQTFPELSNLNLINCGGLEMTWKLPNINLSTLQFSHETANSDYKILVETSNNNASRLYNVIDSIYFRRKSLDYPYYERPYKICPSNETEGSTLFTLSCQSVRNIRFVVCESHVG